MRTRAGRQVGRPPAWKQVCGLFPRPLCPDRWVDGTMARSWARTARAPPPLLSPRCRAAGRSCLRWHLASVTYTLSFPKGTPWLFIGHVPGRPTLRPSGERCLGDGLPAASCAPRAAGQPAFWVRMVFACQAWGRAGCGGRAPRPSCMSLSLGCCPFQPRQAWVAQPRKRASQEDVPRVPF